MKPIQTWDEAQSEIQKQMGEIIKAVWDAGRAEGYAKGLKDGKEKK